MSARDIHAEALDIARRYMRPERGYEGGGEVAPQPTSAPSPSWYDYATGAAGLANRGLAGLPGTVAALGNAAMAGLTLNNPVEAYKSTQRSAQQATDLGTSLYGRDARAAVEEYPGASVMKGATTAAAHGIDNLADAAQKGIILTLPMAERIAKKYLHPDDMGGANRMKEVVDNFRANPPKSYDDMTERLNAYWNTHGVAFYPDLKTGNLEPYTSVQAPNHTGLIFREPGKGAGVLEDFYDDPILYSLNPKAREIETAVDIDPARKHIEQHGGYTPPDRYGPALLRVEATTPEAADNIFAHEVTHVNANKPSFRLPQGASAKHAATSIPSGVTTEDLERINGQIKRALDVIQDPSATHADRVASQTVLDGMIDRAMRSKKMANYLDANLEPGEHLARMEQLFSNARARGLDPMQTTFSNFDDLDLSHMGPGWDWRRYRMIPRDEESN